MKEQCLYICKNGKCHGYVTSIRTCWVRDFTGWQLQLAMLLHYRGNCDFNDISELFHAFFFCTYRRSPTRSTAFTQYQCAFELFALIDCYDVDFFCLENLCLITLAFEPGRTHIQ